MVILLPLIALLFWIPPFFNITVVAPLNKDIQMPLYQLVYGWTNVAEGSFLSDLIACILLILQALLLLQLNNRFPVIKDRTILQSVIFILLSSSVPSLQYLNPALFSNLLFLFSLHTLLEGSRHNKMISSIYEASFYISLGSLFYFPAIFLISIVFATLFITKMFSWREWFVSVLGLLTPYFVLISLLFILDTGYYILWLPLQHFTKFITTNNTESVNILLFMLVGYCTLLLFLSINSTYAHSIQLRKYYAIILSSFFLTVLTYIIYLNSQPAILLFLFVPLSLLYANYFYNAKHKIKSELAYLVFILLLLGRLFM